MPLTLLTVDAFTDAPFGGNPAGVCLLDAARPEEWMQKVAAEMNLSETAFLVREKDAYRLRWFTPKSEIPLCGHATLASAHVLWTQGLLPESQEARFDTLSGRLTARRDGERIAMDFPSLPVLPEELPPGVEDALGRQPRAVLRTNRAHEQNFLVEYASEAEVRGLVPDFRALREIGEGVIATARAAKAGGRYDFVSRYFAGCFGIDEDPVTGSSHCSLIPFWAEKLGKTQLVGYQASARGGFVGGELRGDRVSLFGRAVTVLRGELLA